MRARRRLIIRVAIATALIAGAIVLLRPPDHSSHATVPDANPISLPALNQELKSKGIVIVGENHTYRESSETIKRLLEHAALQKDSRFTHLCLEWPASHQSAFDDYMKVNDHALDDIKREFAPLASVSAELFELVEFVRDLNRRTPDAVVSIWLLDVTPPILSIAEERRDEKMAERVELARSSRDDSRLLLLVGADHAAKSGQVVYKDRQGEFVRVSPLASLLNTRHPGEVTNVDVLTSEDELWRELRGQHPSGEPVAYHVGAKWGSAARLLNLDGWEADATLGVPFVFDYVIAWPTSDHTRRLVPPKGVDKPTTQTKGEE